MTKDDVELGDIFTFNGGDSDQRYVILAPRHDMPSSYTEWLPAFWILEISGDSEWMVTWESKKNLLNPEHYRRES